MALYYRLTDWYVFKGLPKTCWHCEVLGMCRHPKKKGWKFREGSCYLGEDIEETGDFVVNEKEKNEYLLKNIVLPTMDEMISCVAENYGEKAVHVLEKILEDNING